MYLRPIKLQSYCRLNPIQENQWHLIVYIFVLLTDKAFQPKFMCDTFFNGPVTISLKDGFTSEQLNVIVRAASAPRSKNMETIAGSYVLKCMNIWLHLSMNRK